MNDPAKKMNRKPYDPAQTLLPSVSSMALAALEAPYPNDPTPLDLQDRFNQAVDFSRGPLLKSIIEKDFEKIWTAPRLKI